MTARVITTRWKRVRHGSQRRSPAASPTFWWLYSVTKPFILVLQARDVWAHTLTREQQPNQKIKKKQTNKNDMFPDVGRCGKLRMHLNSCMYTLIDAVLLHYEASTSPGNLIALEASFLQENPAAHWWAQQERIPLQSFLCICKLQ